MNLSETSFDKACKRLARIDNSTLSAAQEKLSQVLGHENHAAARRTFKAAAAKSPAVPAPATSKRHWKGVGFRQLADLLELLCFAEARDLAGRMEMWDIRGLRFLRDLLADLFARTDQGPEITAQEIEMAMRLENLVLRYKAARESQQPITLATRGLMSYVANLPSFNPERIGKRIGQSEDTANWHGYTTMGLVRGLQTLRVIETLPADDDRLQQLFNCMTQLRVKDALELVKKIQDERQFDLAL